MSGRAYVALLAAIVVAVIAVTVGVTMALERGERRACAAIGAEPVHVRGSARLCRRPDGTVVVAP